MNGQNLILALLDELEAQTHRECVLSRGTVYGVDYHCVEPRGIPWGDMEQWAEKQFGKPGSIWDIRRPYYETPPPNSRYYMNDSKFWFKDQQDLITFLLRWQ